MSQDNHYNQHIAHTPKSENINLNQKPQQKQFQKTNNTDKFLAALEGLCSRFQIIFESQNARIYQLEKGYGKEISEKFDRLISVNQSIGQSLCKALNKIPFQTIVSGMNSKVWKQTDPVDVPEPAFSLIKTSPQQCDTDNLASSPIQEQLRPDLQQSNKLQLQLVKQNPLIMVEQIETTLLERRFSKSGLISIFKDFAANGVMKKHSESIRHFNKYIGDFYSKYAKHYFDLYRAGKITYDDIRIKFSTDIFNELIQFQGQWIQFILKLPVQELGKCHANGKQFYKIFNQASIKSLRFLIYKYPPSRANLIDMELSEKIKQMKSFSVVKYDLLKNAGMDFGLVQGQTDFSRQIKMWLNRIIVETKEQYFIFKQTMKSIFSGSDASSIDGSNRDVELQYSISSKIPQNSILYSQQEINAPGLIIKNPELLRVLIKWYEELIVYFTNPQEKIISNRYGFKSIHNKQIPIRIPQSKLQQLASHLRKLYNDEILPKQADEHFNIGIFIEGLISISMGGIQGFDFVNEKEITVAKMSECLYEAFKSNLLTFLNLCLQNLVKVRSKYDSGSFQSNIQLITFGIMDILRCRCVGSKQQIYRIYNDIIKNTQYFEIVRIKNKLDEPTKDILINLKLKKSFLICQIQLGLGTSKQHAGSDFCHYLYQLERSKFGVLFQCASQIYNFDPKMVYLKKNPYINFKKDSLIQSALMQRIRVTDCLQCNSCHPYKKMVCIQNTRPFICLCCMSFIPGYFNKLPLYRCNECNFTICHECSISLAVKSDEMMRKTFKLQMPSGVALPSDLYHEQLKNIGLYNKETIEDQLLNVINQYHNYVMLLVIDNNNFNFGIYKKYKSTVVQTFSTIPEIPQMNINSQALKAVSTIIPLKPFQIKKVSELNQHRKIHINFAWCKMQNILESHGIQEVVCIITSDNKIAFIIDVIETQFQIQQFKLKRSAERIVSKLNKFKGTCLEITSKGLNSLQFLQRIDNKNDIITLNLWENKIKDLSILSDFINIEQLYLEENNIENIQPLSHMSKLQLLTIGSNKLSGPLRQLSLPQLQYLSITNNFINDISSLTLSNINSIILLKLSNTLIQKLPKMNFPKLQLIKSDHCRIKDISQFAKSSLQNLNKLNLEYNQISGQMAILDFPMLSVLRICHNKISSLNYFSKSNLPSLITLRASNNVLSTTLIPMNFNELREIDFCHNLITEVSKDLFNGEHFPKLQILLLRSNKFSGAAPAVHIKSLKKLDMGENLITYVSFDMALHPKLEELYFDHNKISQAVGIRKHSTLRKVDVSFNQISNINNFQYWRVPELRSAKFNNNLICCPIPKLYLSNLEYLDLSHNNIKEEHVVQFLHMIPHAIRIDLGHNPPILEQSIKRKYSTNQIKCLSFE